MPWKPVDTAIICVVGPVIDDTDFKTVEAAIAYNATGMSLDWIQEEDDGTYTKTDLTLTTGGTQDWTHIGNGYYAVEITAAQNNEEGIGFVCGICDGVLIFESPHYDIIPAANFNSLVVGSDYLQVDTIQVEGSDATDQINAQCDTAISDASLSTATALATVDGIVDAIVADTGTDGVVLSTATCNKIADHILRRGFAAAAASSDGDTKAFRSLLGAVAKLVNKFASAAGTATIYEADDTTALGTQTITTNASAEPITGLDTN